MSLLEIQNLSLGFKGVKALNDIHIQAGPGKITAVIGPNGAGKTSLFNCISGLYHPQEGSITFDGGPLLGQKPTSIAELGIARTFQNLALFEYLTVLENIQLGRHSHYRSRWWQDLFFSQKATEEELRHREHIEDIIDFLNLESVRDMPVSVLPYGILKRVELARALAMNPKLLLLDEPAAGLNREATEDLARYIVDIQEERGVAILLIEHDLSFVFDLAESIYVLDFGRNIAHGSPDEMRKNPKVTEVYAGPAFDQGDKA